MAGTPGSDYSSAESRGAGLWANISQVCAQLWLNVWRESQTKQPDSRKTRSFEPSCAFPLEFGTKEPKETFPFSEVRKFLTFPRSAARPHCALLRTNEVKIDAEHLIIVSPGARVCAASTFCCSIFYSQFTLFHPFFCAKVALILSRSLWGVLFVRRGLFCNDNQMLPTVPGMHLSLNRKLLKCNSQLLAGQWTLMKRCCWIKLQSFTTCQSSLISFLTTVPQETFFFFLP